MFRLSNFYLKHLIGAVQERNQTSRLLYSMWQCYMKHQTVFKDIETLAGHEWQYVHTSAHAYLDVLKRMATSLSPKALIPIHTINSASFNDHFENIVTVNNGDFFES